ncbi:heavy metal-associated isoprenylated plant protein 2-like [Fagus crenata]
MKKIVIKVSINCQICKTQVLKAVTKLPGIDKVSVDGEKGVLTVIGDVDPVLVVKKLKKIGKAADIISVGPPKPADQCKEIKFLDCRRPCPPSCKECHLIFTTYPNYDGGPCSIL